MTPDQVFQLANLLVLPQWLLMLVAPRWRFTHGLMNSYLIPVALAVIYALYLFGGGPIDFSAFSSLEGIKGLFSSGGDGVMLAGWLHYLAFDLVAGTVVLRDGQANNIAHGWLVLPLVFCFMLGPVGLLLYWVVRTILKLKLVPLTSTGH